MGYKTKIKLPLLGKFLEESRKRAGIKSQCNVADIFHRREIEELKKISHNQINADELGKVNDIPALRLQAYADLYKIPYAQIVSHLVQEKYGVDLVPSDQEYPKTISDVVPPDNAEILQAVADALESERGEEVRVCIERMLALAFGPPNQTGSSATHVEKTVDEKQEGAA